MENIFICENCDKTYSSINSLSNHNRLYHKPEKDKKRSKNTNDNKYHCRYCENKYNNRKSRWAHEQKCVLEKTQDKIEKLIAENTVIKQENVHLKTEVRHGKEVITLHKKLDSANKRNYKTFKSLNTVLKERSIMNQTINITNNSNNNSNNNISNSNNNTNNIQQICNLGEEDILTLTTIIQKLKTVRSGFMSIDNLIEMTYCGENPQFKNVVITNLKDDYGYKYDSEKGYFVTVNKNELLDDIFECRKLNIEEIYEEFANGNRLTPTQKNSIKRFLDACDSDEPFTDSNGVKYANLKAYKKSTIKILLYNNHEKITTEIAGLLDNSKDENRENVLETL